MSERINWGLAVVIFLTALIMFFNLGGIPLLDPDEPVYAETAREMINFHDFVSPRIYGEFWYDKPPMYYWLAAGSFKIFGVSEFAARFPSALLAILSVATIYFSVSRLFDQRTGMVSSLILATSLEFFYLGKAAVTDITLNFFLMVALLAFLEKKYYLFYLAAALATVTKGPVGFLFPGAIIFLYFLLTRRFSEILKMKVPTGIILFLAVSAPWYYFMYKIHGNAFIDTFFGFHNITRFTSPEHPEGKLWYYFIPVLIAGFMPWTAVIFQAIFRALYDGRTHARKLLFLIIWAGFIFLFFSISRTKLVSYILPMFPPLAIIAGWYISKLADAPFGRRPIAWPVILTVLTVVICAGLYFGSKQMPDLKAGAAVAGAVFILMAIGTWYFVMNYKIDKAFWVQVFGMTLFSMVLLTMLLPQAAPAFHSRDIAAEFGAHYDGRSPVYIVKFLRPGFAYYSGVYGQELKNEQISGLITGSERKYLVMRQPDYKSLSPSEKQQLMTLAVADEKLLLLKP